MARKIGFNLGGAFAQYLLGRVALTQGDHEEDASLLEPLLAQTIQQNPDSTEIARLLEGLACLASARGQMERAATIFGANEAAYRRLCASFAPVERAEHQAWRLAARQALGEQSYTSTWAAGEALTLDQVKDLIKSFPK